MKKIIIGLILICSIWAPDIYAERRSFLELDANYLGEINDDITFTSTIPGIYGSVKTTLESAGGIGVAGGYIVGDKYEFKVGLEYYDDITQKFNISGVEYQSGKLSMMPITIMINRYFPFDWIKPYAGIGVGYSLNSFSKNNSFWNPAASVEIDDNWLYLINAGADIRLTQNDNWFVTIAGRYRWGTIDMHAANGPSQLYGSMNIDGYLINVGIKYIF